MKRTFCGLLICGLLLPTALQAAPYDDGHVPADHLMVVDGILVANKDHPLGPEYDPLPEVPRYDNTHLLPVAQTAFSEMAAAAKTEAGLDLFVLSGFRSYQLQESLFNSYSSRSGKDAAGKYSARAGFSEHQTGLACDIGDRKYPGATLEKTFADTPAGKWLAENSWRFGFVLRYMKDKDNITGYQYEPWHFRYVGQTLAKDLHDHQTTLEEWLGLNPSLGRSVATGDVSTIDVNGTPAAISGIVADDHHYYKLRDLAHVLAQTPSAFTVDYNEAARTIVITRQISAVTDGANESEVKNKTDQSTEKAKDSLRTDTKESARPVSRDHLEKTLATGEPAPSKESAVSADASASTEDTAKKSSVTKPSDGEHKPSSPIAEGVRRTVLTADMTVLLDGRPIHPEARLLDGSTYVKLRDLGAALGYIVTWNEETGIHIESLKPLNMNLLDGPGNHPSDFPPALNQPINEPNSEREAEHG